MGIKRNGFVLIEVVLGGIILMVVLEGIWIGLERIQASNRKLQRREKAIIEEINEIYERIDGQKIESLGDINLCKKNRLGGEILYVCKEG